MYFFKLACPLSVCRWLGDGEEEMRCGTCGARRRTGRGGAEGEIVPAMARLFTLWFPPGTIKGSPKPRRHRGKQSHQDADEVGATLPGGAGEIEPRWVGPNT
jgi:hypothetical protein